MSRPSSDNAEFKPEVQKELDAWKSEMAAADAEILRLQEKLYAPLNEKRDAIVSKVEGFWQQAIANCDPVASFLDDDDWQVLAYLQDVKVVRPKDDPRNCKITLTFKDNDFLAENTLTKEFTVKKEAAPLGSDDFDWEQDLVPSKTEVKWKSDDVNLCKKHPVSEPKDEDADSFEPGSFFSAFFECTHPQIACGIGQTIANNFYPQVVDWYTGDAMDFDQSLLDEDFDEDDEEDDEDDEEIDLEEEEKRASKKAKTEK